MRVIFLDIDGVLNCTAVRRQKLREGNFSVIIEPQHVQRLNDLVLRTNAAIVLTSSWRKYWMREGSVDGAGQRIEKAFAFENLSIFDKTPVLDNGSRSMEIEQWLKHKEHIDQYVILDDNDFLWSKLLRQHWVCCPDDTGLTDQLVNLAEKILNGELLPVAEDPSLNEGILGRIQRRIRILLGKGM